MLTNEMCNSLPYIRYCSRGNISNSNVLTQCKMALNLNPVRTLNYDIKNDYLKENQAQKIKFTENK